LSSGKGEGDEGLFERKSNSSKNQVLSILSCTLRRVDSTRQVPNFVVKEKRHTKSNTVENHNTDITILISWLFLAVERRALPRVAWRPQSKIFQSKVIVFLGLYGVRRLQTLSANPKRIGDRENQRDEDCISVRSVMINCE
jgi:hypothetical protein